MTLLRNANVWFQFFMDKEAIVFTITYIENSMLSSAILKKVSFVRMSPHRETDVIRLWLGCLRVL